MHEDTKGLLTTRARGGLGIALVSIAIFALADLALAERSTLPTLYLIKAVSVAVVGFLLVALRSPTARERPIPIILFGIVAICVTTALSGGVSQDYATTRILLVVIVLVTAVLLPWGAWPQAATGAVAMLTYVWNLELVTGGSWVGFDYATAGLAVAAVASVYIAYESERVRVAQVSAENALRESEERFHKVFAASPDAMVISRLADGTLTEVNDAFVRETGFSREESIGQRSVDLGLWVNSDDWVSGLTELRTRGTIASVEGQFRSRSGERIQGLVSAALVTINGEPCVVTSVRDVSEQKAAEQMRRDVVRMLSHDIKNPLAGVIGFAEILRNDLREGRDPTDALDRIDSSAHAAMTLALNFLHADQIDGGSLQIHPAETSMNHIVEEAVRNEAALAHQKEVEVRMDLDPALPRLPLDEPLMDRVVANLLSNAVKFSPRGATVRVVTSHRVGEVAVSVRDQGPGIAPGDRARLFRRYSRGNGSRADSTGLGLFIVKTIAEAHGGAVSVDCPPEGGSVFELSFPHPSAPAP